MAKGKIEDAIAELENYVYNCKNAPLSSTKIICEREVIEDLIITLKKVLPKELEYCRDIMARSEDIEREAKERAEKLVMDATNKTHELLSDNEINQQAIKRADDIVRAAAEQGQEIYDSYVREGNEYRESAQRYLNDMLMNLQAMIDSCIDSSTRNYNRFLEGLNKVGATVTENLNELNNVVDDGSNGQSGETGVDVDMNL